MNKKTHANSRRARLKRRQAPEPPAGIMAAESTGSAEDVEKMAVMIEELRVAEEELRVQNEELAAARQAVEAERARYHELFEFAPDGYLITDGAGIIREANRAASAMLNAPRQGLLGKPFVLYVAGVQRESFRTFLSQVQNEKATKEMEVHLKPRGRPPLSVAMNVAIAQASPGTAIQMRWLLRDITQRKRADEVIRASEARFRSVTQSASDAIISADSRGDILSWNKGAQAIFGYEEEEVWGKPLTLLMPERYREAHLHGLKRVQGSGESKVIGRTVELHGLRKDGSEFPLELSLATWKTWGETYYSAIIRDLTERKRVEAALREGEARLQAILDNSPSLIFLKDTEGRYLLVNQQFEKVFHRTRDEIIGKTDEDIFPTPEARAFRANDLKALQADMPLEFEEVAFHDDGPHTSIVFKFPLRTAEGKTYAMGGVATDISDRKKAEVQLQNSLKLSRALSRRMESVREEERARIARDLHDEVGQALTALKLNLQVVQRDSPDEPRSPLARSVGIIDRLLERVRGISLDLRPSLLDDLGLIATLKWWTEHQAPQRGARIELMADTIEPRLPLDLETACFRIVEEGVNNATKYAKARRINVILRKQDGRLDLLIRDDGRGFDLNAVLARAARGESMGLLGMEERVKHLGGLFTITSQPGQGTELRATFPLGTSAETGEKAEASASR